MTKTEQLGGTWDHRLDVAGIASYLANGVPLAGHAIFEGVEDLSSITGGDYTETLEGVDEHDLEGQLFDLVVAAVARRVPDGPLWLSLSAGYDSRGLLGILRHLGVEDVRCFSYNYGVPQPMSDPVLAAQLARSCGYQHEILPTYKGDLLATISTNAQWGQGRANFCVEADAWESLSDRGISDLMVGDEAFGWIDWPLRTTDDVLDSVFIDGPASLRRLSRHAPEGHRILAEALSSVIEEMKMRVGGISGLHNRKDTLYVEERLRHVLLPWRERFAGRVAKRVHNPLIDPEVLGFVRQLPARHRLNKRLYKAAVRRRLPDLFEVHIASTQGHLPDWSAEIAANLPVIDERLQTPSRLDALLPPKSVQSVVHAAARRRRLTRARAGRLVAELSRRQPIPAGPLYRRARMVDETTLAIRLLVLREVLS